MANAPWGLADADQGFGHARISAAPARSADFYPVLTQAYAVQIARDWNVQASGSGFVTRFEVLKSFLDGYRVEHAGSRAHLEYWIPAEDLPQFNKAIVGEIVVTAAFGKITESTT